MKKRNEKITEFDVWKVNRNLIRRNRELDEIIKRQQVEIERFADIGKMYSEVRAEVVREFAERLTDIICEKIEKSMSNPNGDNYFITDVYTDIDNLVKAMTEKEGGKE